MAETRGEPATPVLVGRTTWKRMLDPETSNCERVRIHDAADPCGHADRTDALVETTREEVEDALADYAVSVQPCHFCGGGL